MIYKQATHANRGGAFFRSMGESIQGITNLVFLCASGTAAYVLWFSSDSLTLHIVAATLAAQTAIQAIAMSTKR